MVWYVVHAFYAVPEDQEVQPAFCALPEDEMQLAIPELEITIFMHQQSSLHLVLRMSLS